LRCLLTLSVEQFILGDTEEKLAMPLVIVPEKMRINGKRYNKI
jgi:hypothetical protein